MDLISVIVPVYKVEKYLDKCVSSIVNQTYRNLEIILVDDGSPDNCGAMCDAWAKKDSRIRVIHKENGGGAQARNTGLSLASGQYIGFVDSDDFLHPSMYQHLLDILFETNSDIAECGYHITDTDEFLPNDAGSQRTLLDTEAALKENIRDNICRQLVWNKLYKASVLTEVRFVEGKFVDDEFFTYKALGNAKQVASTSTRLYYYRQQCNSAMHQKFSLKWLDALDAKAARLQYIKSRFPSLIEMAKTNLLFSCLYQMQQCVRYMSGEEQKTARSKIQAIVRAEMPYPTNPNLSVKQKIWYFLSQWNIEVTARLRNALKLGT